MTYPACHITREMNIFDAALRDIPNFSTDQQDLKRCLDDWYDRGSNIWVQPGEQTRLVNRSAYRRMPKKPWATKEWVDQRDYKLYTLVKDHFSPEWWERVWTLESGYGRHTLIPCSPKFRFQTGPRRRSGSLFRERCRKAIAQTPSHSR